METVYAVIENFQAYDGDGWQHWADQHIVSYHKTLEGANDKIIMLTNGGVNVIWITEGTNSCPEEQYDHYEVKSITLED